MYDERFIHITHLEKNMIRISRTLCYAIGLSVLLALCGAQRAQAEPVVPVSYVYAYGGWYLVEVRDTSDELMGFWGIPRVAVEVGNIRRLWFEALPNDEWNVWAFEPLSTKAKIEALVFTGACKDSVESVEYQEYIAADGALNLDIDGGAEGLVIKGFIEGDPLTEAAGALTNPDPMINLLNDIGYPVAPGMTDLLVTGTAGVNVSVSPATEQALDCIAQGLECDNPCICRRMGGTINNTPWEVESEWVDSNTRLRCTYNRTETHTYWKRGIDPDDCWSCSEGSEEEPIVNIVDREVVIHWFDMTECPSSP